MYTAQAAIGVRFGLNKRWEEIDLTAWTVANLFRTFRLCQLTLLPPGISVPVYANLQQLAATYGTYTGTVAQMLTALGSASLISSPTPWSLDNQKAYFVDYGLAGYKATPVSSVNTIDPTIPDIDQPNVRLTNPLKVVDYLTFFQNCLVSVNGFWHLSDTDGTNGVMVVDANKSLVKSGQGQIGLWNFEAVAPITYVPITPSMVDTSVSQIATVTLPGNLSGQSVFLILGGYLVWVDGVALTMVGPNAFKIDFTQLNMVDRFFESGNYIDLTSLGLQPSPNNVNQISIANLTTPAAILAWLQLSQSYFVVVACPELYSQTLAVKRSGFPNLYYTYQTPVSPLQLETGRMPSYWPTQCDGQWELALNSNVIGNKLYYENPLPSWISSSGANMPGMPGHLANAQLFEVGRDV